MQRVLIDTTNLRYRRRLNVNGREKCAEKYQNFICKGFRWNSTKLWSIGIEISKCSTEVL